MSYVLDALKRSEQDRKQGQVPDLSDQGALLHLTKPSRPLWPVVLIIVLALNAAVLFYLFGPVKSEAVVQQPTDTQPADTRQSNSLAKPAFTQQTPETQPQKPAHETSQVAPAGQVAKVPSGLAPGDIDWAQKEREARRLIEEASAAGSTDVALEQPVRIDPGSTYHASVEPEESENYTLITPKSVPEGGALAFPEPVSIAPQEDVPLPVQDRDYAEVKYLYEMDVMQQPRIPKLKFNSHIYSDQPDARRVMINNIYLSEGQNFSGIEVVRIGESNIVFRKGTTLFKLPAMRDWEG